MCTFVYTGVETREGTDTSTTQEFSQQPVTVEKNTNTNTNERQAQSIQSLLVAFQKREIVSKQEENTMTLLKFNHVTVFPRFVPSVILT